jgi:hypothetical protein
MALSLKTRAPRPRRPLGARAFRLFTRGGPLASPACFSSSSSSACWSALVPLLGGLVQMMALPLLSLGFMIAAVSRRCWRPGARRVSSSSRWRRCPASRDILLKLCLAYGCAGHRAAAAVPTDRPTARLGELAGADARVAEASPQEIDALLADRGVTFGAVCGIVRRHSCCRCPSGMPRRWCTGAARPWARRCSPARWRCGAARAPFLVYMLAWAGLILVRAGQRAAAGRCWACRNWRVCWACRHRAGVLDRVLRLADLHLQRQLRQAAPETSPEPASPSARPVNPPASAWPPTAPATCMPWRPKLTWARASAPLPSRVHHAFAELGVEHRLPPQALQAVALAVGRRDAAGAARLDAPGADDAEPRPLPRCQACWYSRA